MMLPAAANLDDSMRGIVPLEDMLKNDTQANGGTGLKCWELNYTKKIK